MSQYLLKFLETEQYVEDCLNGNLYMNTLRYFRTLESEDINRHDPHETIVSHLQPDFIQIGSLVLGRENCSKMLTSTREYDHCNIFSMYALWPDNNMEQLYIDEQNKNFGNFCLVIHNIAEFLKRIRDKTDSLDIVCQHMRVQYISKNIDYVAIKEEIPFSKFDIFSYQKEFRIAIDTKENVDKPYILNIGDIRDIAFVTSIDKINSSLKSKITRVG